MIRVAVVDDHPALRAGLETVLENEPDIVPVATAESARDVRPMLARAHPDLVLLDYHLPDEDGLQVCRRIKAQALAPRVLLYSAYASTDLAIPAVLAGADGLIGKGIPARELLEAIRAVAGGDRVLPPVPRELLDAASQRIDEADLPILGMLLNETAPQDVQSVLAIDAAEYAARVDRMIGQLRVDIPKLEGDAAGQRS